MSFCELRFPSPTLRLATTLLAILPDTGPGPFPVFYLLHGLSDDHSIWLRQTSIERYVAGLPLIVVMPTTARAWYTNAAAPGIGRYEDYLIHDVVGTIDRLFPTIKHRKGRAIGGLSMGGYGAAKLGLKHHDKFCSITSHSGAVAPFGFLQNPPNGQDAAFVAEMNAIFGAENLNSTNDPAHLAKICPKNRRPALRLDCGTDDFLLAQNRQFHAHLKKLRFPHQYAEFPGAHTWSYWDTHIQEALAFHRKNLNI